MRVLYRAVTLLLMPALTLTGCGDGEEARLAQPRMEHPHLALQRETEAATAAIAADEASHVRRCREEHDGRACYFLGVHDERRGQLAQSFAYHKSGCELGFAAACARAGDIAFYNRLARPVTFQDQIYSMTKKGRRQSAEREAEARRSADEGLALLRRGCDELSEPSGQACEVLGDVYGTDQYADPDQRLAYYARACTQLQSGTACHKQGNVLFGRLDQAADRAQAEQDILAAFQQGCDLHNNASCLSLGGFFMNYATKFKIPRDERRGRIAWRQGCNQDDAQSCLMLGRHYRDVLQDYTQSRTFFRRACELKLEHACRMHDDLSR